MNIKYFITGALILSLGKGALAQTQTGLPVWPLVVPGSGNNDVLVDFAHSYPGAPTSSPIPNTGTNITPAGTGVAVDSCGNMQLYLISNTTTYPANGPASMSTYQENMQQLLVYDKNGNNLPLYDPTWSNTSVPNMNAVSGDREIQVIPRLGYATQWFVIYNEPYQLQASDLNNGSYGYTNSTFQTGYRPSYIKYSLIEYNPTTNKVRRVQPDAYLTANGTQYTYFNGKATDIPVNGNFDLFVAQMNQLTCTSGSWSNQSNIQLQKFQINSSLGTISYVSSSASTNVYVDGYVVAASSLELGASFFIPAQVSQHGTLRTAASDNNPNLISAGTITVTPAGSYNDYRLALNIRNNSYYPDLMIFPHTNFSNPPRIVELSSQRISGTTANAATLGTVNNWNSQGDNFSNKVGALEWDPTGQFLYLTSSDGAGCGQIGDAFLFQLNIADYQAVTGSNIFRGNNSSYGINFQNQDLCDAALNYYCISDIERGYANKLYFSKFNYKTSNQSSGTLFGVDLTKNTSSFQNYTVAPPPAGHDIDFGAAYDLQVVATNSGNNGICMFPDGIDGYNYSRGNFINAVNPAFTLNTISNTSSSTFTVSATTPPLIPGTYFSWEISQVTAPGGTVIPNTTLSNPQQWWYSTDVPTTYFEGYCVPTCNNGGTNFNGPWVSPTNTYSANPIGTFTKGNYYRITRGLWGNCSPWASISQVVYICTGCKSDNGEDVVIIEPDNSYHPSQPDGLNIPNSLPLKNEIPDISGIAELFVSPNPSNGIVNIHINPSQAITGNINITIQNMMGQVMEQKTLVNGELDASFQLESLAKGMYVVKAQYGNTLLSKKLILE